MFGDCHAPCALKTSFVDFERVGALYCYKNLNFSSLLSIRWQSKVIDPVGPLRKIAYNLMNKVPQLWNENSKFHHKVRPSIPITL
jgi:hypothetical protein